MYTNIHSNTYTRARIYTHFRNHEFASISPNPWNLTFNKCSEWRLRSEEGEGELLPDPCPQWEGVRAQPVWGNGQACQPGGQIPREIPSWTVVSTGSESCFALHGPPSLSVPVCRSLSVGPEWCWSKQLKWRFFNKSECAAKKKEELWKEKLGIKAYHC